MNKRIKKTIIAIILIAIIMSNCIFVYGANDFSVNAKASIIVEENSGKIIYEENSKIQNYPASVTKILTAILTLENCKLTDTVTVSKTAISNIPSGYVIAPLFVGEQMTVEDLLYALMLKSANDAAYVLAEHVGGSVDGFSNMMNKKAEELGCKNSHFVNPNGIHNSNHYTTAYDMYLIAKYAMENEEFVKIVSTYQHTLSATNKYSKKDRIMKNTNNFVNPNSRYYDENVKGIKTGTTLQAGNCLITSTSKNGFDVITVVLGAKTAESKFSETKNMMNYFFDNYEYTQIHKKGDVIKSIEVEKATKETKNLNLVISDDIKAMNNIAIKAEEIEPEINLNEEIVAPILKGQELGTIKYTVDGLEYNAKLLAENEVIKKTYYVEILIGAGVLAVIICIIIVIKKKRRKNVYEVNRVE
ncbi:MAG: D-alanyl-D-alanine carboxypeptidase [Clostridia bacterium]|nr:D-alanyl-D-alanine carboxypeptidase [Clostridia bacterium]